MRTKLTIYSLIISCCFLLSACGNNEKYFAIEPLPGFDDLPKDTVSIDPAKEQVAYFKNGASLEIPAGAFTDKNGKTVTKPVQIIVEDYASPSAIIASGIPMKYSENGSDVNLTSAGMFKLEGYCDGEKVNIDPKQKLTMNYPTKSGNNYDLFYLNEQHTGKVITAGLFNFNNSGDNTSKNRGAWKKLTQNAIVPDTTKTLKNFTLNYDIPGHNELIPLQAINWHLATTYRDPTSAANKTLAQNAWTTVHLTRPQKALQEITTGVFANESYKMFDLFFSDDKSIVAGYKKGTLAVWNKTTGANFSVKNIVHDSDDESVGYAAFAGNKYLVANTTNGYALFDMKGKSIRNLGDMYYYQFSLNNNRFVYETCVDEAMMKYVIHVIDFAGKPILEIPVEGQIDYFNSLKHFQMLSGGKILVNASTELKIYNEQGKVISSRPGSYYHFDLFSNDAVLCRDRSGVSSLWYTRNGANIPIKIPDLGHLSVQNTDRDYDKVVADLSGNPYLVLPSSTEGGAHFDVINTLTATSERIQLLSTLNEEKINSTTSLYYAGLTPDYKFIQLGKLGEKGPLLTLPFNSLDPYFFELISVNEKANRILAHFGNGVKLFDLKGKLLATIAPTDTVEKSWVFTTDNHLLSRNKNGVIRFYGLDGKLLPITSKVMEYNTRAYFHSYNPLQVYGERSNPYIAEPMDRICGTNYFNNISGVYKIDGTLEKVLNTDFWELDSTTVLVPDEIDLYTDGGKGEGGYRFYKVVDMPKNAWQLNVSNRETSFFTYVYPDQQTINLMEQYNAFIAKAEYNDVRRAADEAEVIRRFEVAEFGIYNWDKVYKDENVVQFAASFEFDSTGNFGDYYVFVVNKASGNSVIKYSKADWNMFSVNPGIKNKIIAVLPDHKIGLISSDDLEKVDWAAVKRDKKLALKFKTTTIQPGDLIRFNYF